MLPRWSRALTILSKLRSFELGNDFSLIHRHSYGAVAPAAAADSIAKSSVNLLLTKWMKELERIFYGNIIACDAALLPEATCEELTEVLWRNIFSDDGSSKLDAAALPTV